VAIDVFDLGYMPTFVRNLHGAKHELAGRIIIPIYNPYGELVALSSRDWRDNTGRKFWHESYTKTFYLYGFHLAKHNILKYNKAILVEGEFDVAFLHSAGVNMTVGILGTAIHLHQFAILSRYCNEVYIVMDGDDAGLNSIQKTIQFVKLQGFSKYEFYVIPVYLPSDKAKCDPDDFIKKEGRKAFIDLLKQSKENYFAMIGGGS
jgi:DNA primase